MFLHCVQTFAGEPETIFPFFADAHNLEEITPPWVQFDVLTPAPIEMKPGALIDYSLKMNGIPFRWRTEITDWEPSVRFVDRQVRGPYRRWIHEHLFLPRDGNTEMHDQVSFAAPGGFLVEPWFVKPRVKQIFEYRQEVMARRFEQVGEATMEFRTTPSPALAS